MNNQNKKEKEKEKEKEKKKEQKDDCIFAYGLGTLSSHFSSGTFRKLNTYKLPIKISCLNNNCHIYLDSSNELKSFGIKRYKKPTIKNVKKLLSIYESLIVVTKDQKLYCKGSNYFGGLGLEKLAHYPSLTLNSFFYNRGLVIKKIQKNNHTNFFLTKNHQLFLGGLFYQNTTQKFHNSNQSTPKLILKNVSKFFLNYRFSKRALIQKQDGTVYFIYIYFTMQPTFISSLYNPSLDHLVDDLKKEEIFFRCKEKVWEKRRIKAFERYLIPCENLKGLKIVDHLSVEPIEMAVVENESNFKNELYIANGHPRKAKNEHRYSSGYERKILSHKLQFEKSTLLGNESIINLAVLKNRLFYFLTETGKLFSLRKEIQIDPIDNKISFTSQPVEIQIPGSKPLGQRGLLGLDFCNSSVLLYEKYQKPIANDWLSFFKRQEMCDDKIITSNSTSIGFHSHLAKIRLGECFALFKKKLFDEKSKKIKSILKWVYSGILKNYFEKNLIIDFVRNDLKKDMQWLYLKSYKRGLRRDLLRLYQTRTERLQNDNELGFQLILQNEETVLIDRFIIQARSELFRGLFLSVSKKDTPRLKEHCECSQRAVELFIKFLYLGNFYENKTKKMQLIFINKKIYDELLLLEDFYQITTNIKFQKKLEKIKNFQTLQLKKLYAKVKIKKRVLAWGFNRGSLLGFGINLKYDQPQEHELFSKKMLINCSLNENFAFYHFNDHIININNNDDDDDNDNDNNNKKNNNNNNNNNKRNNNNDDDEDHNNPVYKLIQYSFGKTKIKHHFKSKIIKISKGRNHFLFLFENGQILGQGNSKFGQLNIEKKKNSRKMINIIFPNNNSKIIDIHCSSTISYFLTIDNQLFAIGDNRFKEIDKNDNARTIIKTPKLIRNNVLKVWCNELTNNIFIQTIDGDIYTKGFNNNGQLGIDSSKKKVYTKWKKVNFFQSQNQNSSNKIIKISPNKLFTIALIKDNKLNNILYSSGQNTIIGFPKNSKNFQLIQKSIKLQPTQVYSLRYSYLIITKSKQIYVCGLNDKHQLGIKNQKKCDQLTKIYLPILKKLQNLKLSPGIDSCVLTGDYLPIIYQNLIDYYQKNHKNLKKNDHQNIDWIKFRITNSSFFTPSIIKEKFNLLSENDFNLIKEWLYCGLFEITTFSNKCLNVLKFLGIDLNNLKKNSNWKAIKIQLKSFYKLLNKTKNNNELNLVIKKNIFFLNISLDMPYNEEIVNNNNNNNNNNNTNTNNNNNNNNNNININKYTNYIDHQNYILNHLNNSFKKLKNNYKFVYLLLEFLSSGKIQNNPTEFKMNKKNFIGLNKLINFLKLKKYLSREFLNLIQANRDIYITFKKRLLKKAKRPIKKHIHGIAQILTHYGQDYHDKKIKP
ncbi:hypothetical protein M0812_07574 [Anaeramoeba flamelloides]|uniref:BTB domain-containing protein n=1 Tax=Anaeramoeba flamelloides TaxID=1746091 RepID=A0AAV7ZZE9_9EUKA|nr:hypothetical protein M0812_07574 [Anaeramoeba flamelloides]